MQTYRPRKYSAPPAVDLPDREWPNRVLTRAPAWCSVDLRDGNQALPDPMGVERKLRLFAGLVRLGFKEIEVSFPSASRTEYDFTRRLIDEERIPDDVTIQVLTQAREPLVRRTFEAIRGARRAVVHLYNSTSEVQRRVVFGLDREGVAGIAVAGARWIRDQAAALPGTEVTLEYSPESFTGTELDYALEVCERVMEVWQPAPERKVILNLPATVEVTTPNVYADRIEWFGRRLARRDSVVLSVHPHNDRGSAVAAAELAVLAGADRVEGTLLGNGERTGNVDLVTLALNLFSQGIDPGLDFSDLPAVARLFEEANRLPVHPRHPYAGELVFTAFSGSHQDAIRKGFAAQRRGAGAAWEVPYLPIDPEDIGRSYESVIRINSQSGKGGVAYVLEEDFGLRLPKKLAADFSRRVKDLTDASGEEMAPPALFAAFEAEYLRQERPVALHGHHTLPDDGAEGGPSTLAMELEVAFRGQERTVRGRGNGPIDAFANALRQGLGLDVEVLDYSEHAAGEGADAQAVAYIEIAGIDGASVFGVGRSGSIVTASLAALVSAVNRREASSGPGLKMREGGLEPPRIAPQASKT